MHRIPATYDATRPRRTSEWWFGRVLWTYLHSTARKLGTYRPSMLGHLARDIAAATVRLRNVRKVGLAVVVALLAAAGTVAPA